MGRREKSLICDPGFKLRLSTLFCRKEREKKRAETMSGMGKKVEKKYSRTIFSTQFSASSGSLLIPGTGIPVLDSVHPSILVQRNPFASSKRRRRREHVFQFFFRLYPATIPSSCTTYVLVYRVPGAALSARLTLQCLAT